MTYEFHDPYFDEHLAEMEYRKGTEEIDLAQEQFEIARAEEDSGKAALWAWRVIALCLGRDDGYPAPPRAIPEWAIPYIADVAEGIYDVARLRNPLTRPDIKEFQSNAEYAHAYQTWAQGRLTNAEDGNKIILRILGFSSSTGKGTNPFKNFWYQTERLRAATISWWYQKKATSSTDSDWVPDIQRAVADYQSRHNVAEKAAKNAIKLGSDIDARLKVKPRI